MEAIKRLAAPLSFPHIHTTQAGNMAPLTIPRHQKAAVCQGAGEKATAPVKQIDVELPGPSEILVKINWSESLKTALDPSPDDRAGQVFAHLMSP